MPEKKKTPVPAYKVVMYDIEESRQFEKLLNDMDRKGWEFVTIQEMSHTLDEMIVFRRKK